MAKGPPAPQWRIQSKCTAFFWSVNKEQRSLGYMLTYIRFFFSWSITPKLKITLHISYPLTQLFSNSKSFVEGRGERKKNNLIFVSTGPFITLEDSQGLMGARQKTNGNRRLCASRRITSEMPHFPLLPIHRCGLSKSSELTRACLRRAPTQVSPLLAWPALHSVLQALSSASWWSLYGE